MKQIDKLIINSPYEEPKYYLHYDREPRSFERHAGRSFQMFIRTYMNG